MILHGEFMDVLVDYCIYIAILLYICINLFRNRYVKAKIVSFLENTDPKDIGEAAKALFHDEKVQDFIFDSIMNIISHAYKAGALKEYTDDAYNTMKGQMLNSKGNDTKLVKKASKEILNQLITAHPIGQYATMLLGEDQIHEFLGTDDDPQKALEKLKIIMGMMKNYSKKDIGQMQQQFMPQQL